MGKHSERALAFQALYGHALTRAATQEQLGQLYDHAARCGSKSDVARGFGWELALGAWSREDHLNAIIGSLALGRPLQDIGRPEQVLLRLGLYEIIYQYTPPKVVMRECMILAEEFGIGPGGKFVNGVLDAASRSLGRIREEA